jgi:hypothetical protein
MPLTGLETDLIRNHRLGENMLTYKTLRAKNPAALPFCTSEITRIDISF